MSILSSIGSAISGAYNTVKNTVSNFLTSSPQSLTASAGMSFPVGAGMTPSQTATANKVIAGGGSTPSYTNPYNITVGNTGGGMTSIYPGAVAPAPVSFSAGVKTGSGQNMTPLTNSFSFGGGSSSGYGASGDYASPAYSANALTTSSYPSFSSPTTSAVTTSSIGTQPAQIGSAPSATNYNGNVVMNNTAVGANPNTGMFDAKGTVTTADGKTTTANDQQNSDQAALDKYLADLKKPASEADAYNRAVQETNLLQIQQQRNNTQNAINGITAKMNSDLLQLRGTAGREGVTEAVYGGQQAEITREATISLLPLQAQLAADQGNLELAQQNTNTLFQIYAKDAQNSVDYYNNQAKAVYDFATAQQKKKLDELVWQKNFNADMVKQDASKQADIAMQFLKDGNMAGYKAVTAVRPPVNMQSANFAQEYQNYKNSLARAVASSGGGSGSATPLTALYTNAFNSAATGLPEAQAKQAKATFNSLIASGDTQGAKDYLLRVAVSSAPKDQQNQIVGRMQAVDSLGEIQTLLEQARAKGVDTNILSGNIVKAAQKLGTSTDQDLSYIGSRIQQVLQTYRRSMTGVAFSPSEAAEYSKIMPDITNVNDLNMTKVNALRDGLNANNRSALSFYIGGTNYDQIYGARPIGGQPPVKAKPVTSGTVAGGKVTFKVIK